MATKDQQSADGESADVEAPYVMSTVEDDGSAELTVNYFGDDHRFSVYHDSGVTKVSFEETLSYRGSIHTTEPDEDVWQVLLQSEEFAEVVKTGSEIVRE